MSVQVALPLMAPGVALSIGDLRPYQQDALDAILAARARKVRRQLVVMATGLGKGHLVGHLPEALDAERMLVLAHREEIVDQLAGHLRRGNPGVSVGVEQADRWVDPDTTPLVVASVQTLASRDGRRMRKWHDRAFDVVVADECHHFAAPMFRRPLQYFGCGEPDGALLIGMTATGFRGDGKPLANVFDELVFERDLRWGIEAGFLSRIRAKRINTDASLADVSTRLGDFSQTELIDAVNTDYRNSLIGSAIENHASGRSAIVVFCVDVAHVEALATQLRLRGHSAESITGHTPGNDRWRILKRFREGETRILVNCAVLTEGWDAPMVDCIVMARPTKSPLLYQQILGRGTRLFTAKQDLLVLDVVDVCGRHHIQTAATAFGVREVDLLGEDVLEAVEEIEKATARGVKVDDGDTLADVTQEVKRLEAVERGTIRVRTKAEAVDIFARVELLDEVERESEFPWIARGRDAYVLPLFERNRKAHLVRSPLGVWSLTIASEGIPDHRYDLDDGAMVPFKAADRIVKREAGKRMNDRGETVYNWKALSHRAWWQRQPATPKQMDTLRKMGFEILPPNLQKGAASRMISQVMEARAMSRAGATRIW